MRTVTLHCGSSGEGAEYNRLPMSVFHLATRGNDWWFRRDADEVGVAMSAASAVIQWRPERRSSADELESVQPVPHNFAPAGHISLCLFEPCRNPCRRQAICHDAILPPRSLLGSVDLRCFLRQGLFARMEHA